MKLLYTLMLLVLTASSLFGANVYVSMGSFESPHYEFYSDSDGTLPLTALDVSESYTFYRLNNAPIHPFYISDVGNGQEPSSKISITGDGSASSGITGTQNFTLTFNDFNPASDTLYFFCTVHASMLGQFNFDATLPLIGTSDLFENTSNATWTRFIALALIADGVSSQAAQTMQINITDMPEGARYRVGKTVANGSWYFASGQDLVIGLNTINVGAVNFNRSVKIQFDQGGVEFDSLTVNGVALYGEASDAFTAPAGSVLASSVFAAGASAYPYAYTGTLPANGVEGHAQQTFILNVTALPEGGANYSIYKTTANGSDDTAAPTPLVVGTNTISVPAVDFDRTVKLRISADVAIDQLIVNGVYIVGTDENAFTAPAGSVLASSEFSTGSEAYPYVYTSALTADGATSQAEQSFTLNVTALPEGGANYSIYKTTANGSEFTADPVALELGENIISVAAVVFDRTVKLRLSADVAIDQLIVNDEYIVGAAPLTAPEGSVLASSLFDSGTTTYPYLYTMALTDDGASSQEAQTMILNVTALPEGGASYSVFKTTVNGYDNIGADTALIIGENIITASGVSFDRTVKIRLTADVAIDSLSDNGNYILGSAPAGPPEGSVYPDNDFDLSSNGSWPYVYTAALASDGASSQAAFQFLIVVTALPEAGANYTINKTTASGAWYTSDPKALVLGVNRFTVPAVDFDRTVKFRLSSTTVAYEYFGVNQMDVYGTPLDSDSDGVNDWTDYAPNDPDVQVAPPAEAPALSISSDGTDITLQWSDSAGFQVHSSDDLSSWTSTGDSESPYTESIGTTKFFKLAND
ncbi:MAG: hypothetical protein P8I61_05285 [Opitutae bacterium]|nr:hypothetical protein [Opitutae bacterium]